VTGGKPQPVPAGLQFFHQSPVTSHQSPAVLSIKPPDFNL